MGCGIELTANGEKVAWSIAEYLSALTKAAEACVAEHTQAAPAPAAKPAPAATSA